MHKWNNKVSVSPFVKSIIFKNEVKDLQRSSGSINEYQMLVQKWAPFKRAFVF